MVIRDDKLPSDPSVSDNIPLRRHVFYVCIIRVKTMYSLYRAWLSLGPAPPPPPPPPPPSTASTTLNLGIPAGQVVPGAPDVSLQVGPGMTHFSAHKSVLSAHSGFFKAALATHTGKRIQKIFLRRNKKKIFAPFKINQKM